MQVDKNSEPISHFIANFNRQFKEAKRLLNLDRLFGGKTVELKKRGAEPESIIGATKTLTKIKQKVCLKNRQCNQNATGFS